MTADQERSSEYWAARDLAQSWAQGTARQVQRLRAAVERASALDDAFARGQAGDLDAFDDAEVFGAAWVEQHLLAVAVQQFHKWAGRMLTARGEVSPTEDRLMRLVRNSLEHLDEAVLTGDEALPGPTGNSSLRSLPGSRLSLRVATGTDRLMICGLVDVETIEQACRALAEEIIDDILGPSDDLSFDPAAFMSPETEPDR
ncbi:hypothetical protein SAMN04488074_109219 [Lentzea albidocapillata subsp. violacea]|uniref:Uncharacterized protein n=1 Tax=Lentzea albidocapillata subsp. violacea TaxID=128104 RepID=A0A1G9HZV8_9PSEU|nr:hypothetical protein [Lentzea albidocapillata]SDL18392.1 hypothetical protein SAMN04488074_109219 [Lentzea albidocapillata subsp. violacea]